VLVTHHLEEIPTGVADVALVREGRVVASGSIETTLDDANVSAAFGLDVTVRGSQGRYSAVAKDAPGAATPR
jgi:iron complex transport system ATP-binding protein